MPLERAQTAIAAAALSLIAFGAGVAAFMPPLNRYTLDSPLLATLAGIGIAVALLLHLIFVGIAARRVQRRPALWVLLALLTFPIGSIVGLVLFEFFGAEAQAGAKAA